MGGCGVVSRHRWLGMRAFRPLRGRCVQKAILCRLLFVNLFIALGLTGVLSVLVSAEMEWPFLAHTTVASVTIRTPLGRCSLPILIVALLGLWTYFVLFFLFSLIPRSSTLRRLRAFLVVLPHPCPNRVAGVSTSHVSNLVAFGV